MESKWRQNVANAGMVGYLPPDVIYGVPFDLFARVLEGQYAGWYITNLPNTHQHLWYWSGFPGSLPFNTGLPYFRDTSKNFPYGLVVEPDRIPG